MKLTRRIPARTETLIATWCKHDWLVMSPEFRAIRANSHRPMDKCGWCRRPFQDGDMMALACFEKCGNKNLCQSCAAELLASANEKAPA